MKDEAGFQKLVEKVQSLMTKIESNTRRLLYWFLAEVIFMIIGITSMILDQSNYFVWFGCAFLVWISHLVFSFKIEKQLDIVDDILKENRTSYK